MLCHGQGAAWPWGRLEVMGTHRSPDGLGENSQSSQGGDPSAGSPKSQISHIPLEFGGADNRKTGIYLGQLLSCSTDQTPPSITFMAGCKGNNEPLALCWLLGVFLVMCHPQLPLQELEGAVCVFGDPQAGVPLQSCGVVVGSVGHRLSCGILAGLPVGQQQGPGGVAGEAADGGGGRSLRGGREHQIHLQGLCAEADPEVRAGKGQGWDQGGVLRKLSAAPRAVSPIPTP